MKKIEFCGKHTQNIHYKTEYIWQNLLPALQLLKVTPLKVWWRRCLTLLTHVIPLLELNVPVPWFQQRSLTDLLLIH